MKKFDNLKMVLFDSTNASFRLAVEAHFVRGNPQQGYKDLVYITDRGSGVLNPNIYLTIAYKGEDNPNPVYTSYPQLFRIREALGKVKDLVVDNRGFLNIDGAISVRQECSEPVVVSNIGKGNNWISLKLVVIETGENGVHMFAPGVSIELSTSNHAASVLSVDEFLTVYTIINDLDLSSIQCQMALAFLNTDRGTTTQPAYGYAQPAQPYYQPQPAQPPYVANPQPGYYNPQQGAARPRYNQGGGYQGQRTTAPQPRAVQVQPTRQPATRPEPNTTALPPRTGSSIMSLGAVEDTPIVDTDYSDTSAIDAIFDE